ncbi:hypothetical protein [Streptomyces smyrnaeus]|uniref:hypothetical protein n=1 Tax=Streptomyces smyrnaeus TaxID=1387713 RepID=UPI0036A67415
MRDLISLVDIWLGEPVRRRLRSAWQRAAVALAGPQPPESTSVLPAGPAYARRPPPEHVRRRERPLDGEALALVRPYVIAHERGAKSTEAAVSEEHPS